MTTWTEAQIDRHLHLWEHRHGPDSPEAGIVRQLRAERDALRNACQPLGLRSLVAGWNGEGRDDGYAPHPPQLGVTLKTTAGVVYAIDAAIPTTQETPHE